LGHPQAVMVATAAVILTATAPDSATRSDCHPVMDLAMATRRTLANHPVMGLAMATHRAMATRSDYHPVMDLSATHRTLATRRTASQPVTTPPDCRLATCWCRSVTDSVMGCRVKPIQASSCRATTQLSANYPARSRTQTSHRQHRAAAMDCCRRCERGLGSANCRGRLPAVVGACRCLIGVADCRPHRHADRRQ